MEIENNQIKIIKVASGFLLSAFIILIAYYGTYLPMHKSQVFINAMRNIQSAQNVGEAQTMFIEPFSIKSPIGQEELVRNASNIFLSILQDAQEPEIVPEIIDFVSLYYDPIIKRGKGMSFGQNLYILGAINEVAFVRTGETKYLESSKRYYLEGFKLGPKRPQPLYGLFDIYRIEGNVEMAKNIAGQILEQWPNDTRTRDGIAEFLSNTTGGTGQN